MRDKLQKAWNAAGCISSGVDAVHKVLSDAGIRLELPSFEARVRRVWDDTRSNAAVVDYAMKFAAVPESVTWTFEVATTIEMDGNGNVTYGGWQARTGTLNPTAAPEGMVRNVKARTAQQSRDAECLDVLRSLLLKAHVGTPQGLKDRAVAMIKVLETGQ